MTDKIYLKNVCHKCIGSDQNYSRKGTLRKHLLSHGLKLSSCKGQGRKAVPPFGSSFTDQQTEDSIIAYSCPACPELFTALGELDCHVTKCHVDGCAENDLEPDTEDEEEEEDFFPEDYLVTDADLPTVSPSLDSSLMPLPAPIVPSTSVRSYDDAVLSACQESLCSKNRQTQILHLVDSLGLQPVSLVNKLGCEDNILSHKRVMANVISSCDQLKPTAPKRQRQHTSDDDLPCVACSPKMTIGLETLLSVSPYTRTLNQRQYAELTPALCALMNYDWDFFPQTKFSTATMLAGAIMINTFTGHTIMINTVEVFGRIKNVDSFREPHGKLKGTIKQTSLPPTNIKTLYPCVWPVSIQNHDGKKIVIGTEVSNALVTSSIRLDCQEAPVIGSTTSGFDLNTINDSLSTKIFVDVESMNSSLAMMNDNSTSRISNANILYQIRQLRSKFDHHTAYQLTRASGPLTRSHIYHPYTVFTLADQDASRNSVALLFRSIALLVLKKGSAASLDESIVQQYAASSTGKNKEVMDKILDLYKQNNDKAISILENHDLNKQLVILSDLLMPSIVAANATVAKYVASVFN
ncbi:hypothetical protein [Absidia glauca]|uniref:C2H2-type domain-containing protein n=1 Tax=Absidia glauca TaxID=4829 RepID=A0A163JA86_ABSGL|nr:hypothetical protein [Absidia glauca]